LIALAFSLGLQNLAPSQPAREPEAWKKSFYSSARNASKRLIRKNKR
jgi:hypothetical protein